MHHLCGLDLVDFFRGRHSWRKFYALVTRFPQHSTLRVAVAQDEELAWKQVELVDEGDGRPPLAEWSLTANLLASVVDRLGELIAVTAAAPAGKQPQRVKPVPRPTTALAKVTKLRQQQEIDELFAAVKYVEE